MDAGVAAYTAICHISETYWAMAPVSPESLGSCGFRSLCVCQKLTRGFVFTVVAMASAPACRTMSHSRPMVNCSVS